LRNRDLDAPFHGVRLRADSGGAHAATAADLLDESPVAMAARFHRAAMLVRARTRTWRHRMPSSAG